MSEKELKKEQELEDKIAELLKKKGVQIDSWDVYYVEEGDEYYEISYDGKIYIKKVKADEEFSTENL